MGSSDVCGSIGKMYKKIVMVEKQAAVFVRGRIDNIVWQTKEGVNHAV